MADGRDRHACPQCSVPKPYPEPKVASPNLYYAILLLEDYTGVASEMTAINQYIYHSFVFRERYPELHDLEECIAITEMKHLELLAGTIELLGVDPQFRTLTANVPAYWNAAVVYYGTEVCDRLAADVTAEIEAIQNYRQHQQLIDDPYIQQLLERIILDEQLHLKLFREASARYCTR